MLILNVVICYPILSLHKLHHGLFYVFVLLLFFIPNDSYSITMLHHNGLTKGLNSIHKLWLALKEFKSSATDIILVQETNFRSGRSFKFTAKHFPVSFIASDPSGKAGVAILLKTSCFLRVKSSYMGPHGRYIFLDCDYLSRSFTLVNIYAPNSGQIQFLTDVLWKLGKYASPL